MRGKLKCELRGKLKCEMRGKLKCEMRGKLKCEMRGKLKCEENCAFQKFGPSAISDENIKGGNNNFVPKLFWVLTFSI